MCCCQDGATALMIATEEGHVAIVQLLLNTGATVMNDKSKNVTLVYNTSNPLRCVDNNSTLSDFTDSVL